VAGPTATTIESVLPKVAVMTDRTYLPVSLFADNKYRTVSCLASFGNDVQKSSARSRFWRTGKSYLFLYGGFARFLLSFPAQGRKHNPSCT